MKPHADAIRAIAFDLDGTLVDSAPDIAHALNSALRQSGLATVDVSSVRSWIGDGPDRLIARALASMAPDCIETPALRGKLRQLFNAATFAAPLTHGAVYPDMLNTLQTLHGTWPLVVVTNKPTALARAVLEAAGLMPMIKAVYGADRAELRKPQPAMLLQAARDLSLKAQQLLMVGDSAADMDAAKTAGAQAALVGWGYGHPEVKSPESWWQIHHPAQLLALLKAT
jgi:phosphoglycolate phosphatase